MNPREYNITIRQGIFEGEECFEARVKELPDLFEYADTYEEAYELALDAIETTAEEFDEKGRLMPAPWEPEDDYSGRVTIRMPKSLHRALAEGAEDEGVSLNQYMIAILSAFNGFSYAVSRSAEGQDWTTLQKGLKSQRGRPANVKLVYSKEVDGDDGWRQTG